MSLLLSLAPWAAFLAFLPALFRRRPRLRNYTPPPAGPRVSVIVPARNEATNIGGCIRSLLNTSHPNAEIVVVDDRSEDGTGEIVRALAERGVDDVVVIDGEPLPPGWFGKPWACWQGYRRASGELLLFTDADTRHEPALLGHAVAALEAEGADLVTILPRQVLASFWERVVMPQFLITLMLRFGNARRINRARDPLDVIANGQFILMRREAYEAIGGHEAVRGEVVEDLRLAQRVVAAGHRLFVAHAEDLMSTRMYASLREIIIGWSKNVATGARQTVAPWLRPALPYLIAGYFLLMWVLPPAVLAASLLAGTSDIVLAWAAGATGLSLLFWLLAYARLGVWRIHSILYPLGAAIAAWIFLRSALRGSRVEWKGRIYGDAGR
ncbi:MAG TPA: glycosyltransferase family 2 protein [Longimicrobiales bacterium]